MKKTVLSVTLFAFILSMLTSNMVAGNPYQYLAPPGQSENLELILKKFEIPQNLHDFFTTYNINPEKTLLFWLSGGDCAGINSAYYGAVMEAADRGLTVLGVMNGLEGLGSDPEEFVNNLFIHTPETIESLRSMPSLYLGSSRAKYEKFKKNIQRNCAPFLGSIGNVGDNHAEQAFEMDEDGIATNVIGKTIDADFKAVPLGFDSAVDHVRALYHRALKKARIDGEIQIVEIMGRDATFLAWAAGKDAGDDSMTLPSERPALFKDVLLKMLNSYLEYGHLGCSMAEGYIFEDFSKVNKKNKNTLFYTLLDVIPFLKERFYSKGQFDDHDNPKLTGIAEYLTWGLQIVPYLSTFDKELHQVYAQLREKYPDKFEFNPDHQELGAQFASVKMSILGYSPRGEQPNSFDEQLGIMYGREAVRHHAEGVTGIMVTIDKDTWLKNPEYMPRRDDVKAVNIQEFAKKQYLIQKPSSDADFYMSDKEAVAAGVWFLGSEELNVTKNSQYFPSQGDLFFNASALHVARVINLNLLGTAKTHNTVSIAIFPHADNYTADIITAVAANKSPVELGTKVEEYVLKDTHDTIISLNSQDPDSLTDFLVRVLKIMNTKREIRDEKRIVRELAYGFVNIAVPENYSFIDFQEPSNLFKRLLTLNPVLKERYNFDENLFKQGRPGQMNILAVLFSAITYLPQLVDEDASGKLGNLVAQLKQQRPGIFKKDADHSGNVLIKGVRITMPNQTIGNSQDITSPEQLKSMGVHMPLITAH